MAKRIFLAALLGGLTIFIWGVFAHMVLGIGEIGVKEIPNEGTVLQQLHTTVPESGFYLFPSAGMMSAKNSAERDAAAKVFAEKYQGGPHGLLVFHSSGASMAMGRQIAVEFLLNFFQALLAAWLLSKAAALAGYFPRVIFVTVAGVLASVTTNIQYWNWYQFPSNYTSGYVITTIVGFFLAGLAIAAMVRSESGGLQRPA